MFGWLKRLFGAGAQWDAELPDFTMEAVAAEDVKEVVDWGLQSLGIPEIWTTTKGEGIKVAVLDTGIATKHPDFKGAIEKTKDFTGSSNGAEDGNGHGTHCAGIIGARMDQRGVIGVAPQCRLMAGKVLSDSGRGSLDWIADGMQWALDEGADIISMSLGSSRGNPKLEEATRKIIDSGKILIVAAGNAGEGGDTIKYPGRYKDVICVGSIRRGMERSDFSSVGANLTIMAPGEKVLSCYPPDRYSRLSGTSMATPFVAGVAALILAKHRMHGGETPCENQKQMLEHLTKVAKDIGDEGWDKETGWGIINPGASMASQ